MKATRIVTVVAVLVGAGMLAACGGPKFPNCEKDEHCAQNDQGAQINFVCFNQQCVECVEDAQCTAKDPTMVCNPGSKRCEVKAECTTDPDCQASNPGYVCRASKCVPECAQDADCGSGQKCESQKCVTAAQCASDVECGPNMECRGGQCFEKERDPWANVSAKCKSNQAGQPLALGVIRFDFDKSNVRPDMRGILDGNATCLKQGTKVTLVLEGHADERGTQEYNLALGEQRADTIRQYLVSAGVDPSRVRVVSKGENEPVCRSATDACYEKNRRVEFRQSIGN